MTNNTSLDNLPYWRREERCRQTHLPSTRKILKGPRRRKPRSIEPFTLKSDSGYKAYFIRQASSPPVTGGSSTSGHPPPFSTGLSLSFSFSTLSFLLSSLDFRVSSDLIRDTCVCCLSGALTRWGLAG
ncbi:hypothetical protein YC2023_096301 [Brassica napus]